LLIPEIHVVRGKTYTFVVEGGQDPEFAAGNLSLPIQSEFLKFIGTLPVPVYDLQCLWIYRYSITPHS
jgi:hypothetical protein